MENNNNNNNNNNNSFIVQEMEIHLTLRREQKTYFKSHSTSSKYSNKIKYVDIVDIE